MFVEGGNFRHIQVLSLRERIAINAVMRVVDKHLLPRYIRTTSASIVGRGMHDLMNISGMIYVMMWMEQDTV